MTAWDGEILIAQHLRQSLTEVNPESGKTRAQEFADRMVELALGGSVTAMTAVLARVDGPISQKLVVSQLSDEQILRLLRRGRGSGIGDGSESEGLDSEPEELDLAE